ncbi:hypothetical protein EDD63_12632 [Breznakia blatticola]|uniref:Phage-Barnase-EndoU-ColicinE5/D-RelE like nuclease 3 domain-containing protein n=1 Tax=Breznakia blatticola TaxID=1754012 RepID=A0A4R7ZIR5_9FIRM|nr:hypothetical protein [Breznakia blatticola]TDW16268.1 hypothetical protein EDD63_12632 [Breznakia blatticola]
MDKSIKVGLFKQKYNTVLNTNFPIYDIVKSNGLKHHLIKNNHSNCLCYLDKIEEILHDPTYIGQNARHSNSIELIKRYDDNILVAMKLDNKHGCWYVASVYDVPEEKIIRRLHSGRLKKYK